MKARTAISEGFPTEKSPCTGLTPYAVQLAPPIRRNGLPPTGIHLTSRLRVTLRDVERDAPCGGTHPTYGAGVDPLR